MSQDRAIYTQVRCEVCGRPWLAWYDPATGKGEGPHPDDAPCSIHKPPTTPPWVGKALARHELAATASHLPPTASDAEIAWRELAGGVPTREWPEAPSIPPGEFLAAVVARANGKDGEA